MLPFLSWLLIIEILGLAALPVAWRLFRNLPDRGYALARPLGLLLTSYAFWLLVTFGFLRNTWISISAVIVAVGAAAWATADREALLAFLGRERGIIVATEVLFLVTFAGWTVFRAYNPEIMATEKPMEFAFLNAVLRAETFPPPDPWLSGFAISYYYFGYVMMAMLTKLSALDPAVTFNLGIALLFSLTCTGAFSLVYNLVQSRGERGERGENSLRLSSPFSPLTWGFLGTLFVAIIGNLEGLLEVLHLRGVGSAAFWQWLDIKDLNVPPTATGGWLPTRYLWWWRASRVVHDVILGQESEVIDEFPFFSFLLGDMHPHVLALPFVFLALGLALNVLRGTTFGVPERFSEGRGSPTRGLGTRDQGQGTRELRGRLLAPLSHLGPLPLLVSLCLGALGFLNSWDFPTYLLIFLGAYAMRRYLERGQADRVWLADVVIVGVVVLALGLLLYLPFYLGFQSQAGGLRPVLLVKTRWQQYLVMFGVFVFIVAGLLAEGWSRLVRRGGLRGLAGGPTWPVAALALPLFAVCVLLRWWTAAMLILLIALTGLLWLHSLGMATRREVRERMPAAVAASAADPDLSWLFVLLLVAVGLALTLSTEFVYIKDAFNSRMNTVFKFYYQAWVLLAVSSAFGLCWLVRRGARASEASGGASRFGLVARWPWLAVVILLVLAGLVYPVLASWTKAGAFKGPPTLDGMAWFRGYRSDDYAAIRWLRENMPPGTVVLQAAGGSYSEAGWIAAATGLPTLLGWDFHELQWRGTFDEPARRHPIIQAIYQSTDINQVSKLLNQENVDCVYVGPFERQTYNLSPPQVDKFARFMTPVYQQGAVVIYCRR